MLILSVQVVPMNPFPIVRGVFKKFLAQGTSECTIVSKPILFFNVTSQHTNTLAKLKLRNFITSEKKVFVMCFNPCFTGYFKLIIIKKSNSAKILFQISK
jgi:hypothetical protein